MASGSGTIQLFFTGTPSEEAGAVVTGQTGLDATSHIEAWFQHGDTASGNGMDEHEEAAALCPLNCKFSAPGQFAITAQPMAALGVGFFNVHFFWSTNP